MTKFDDMPAADFEALEKIVGVVDREAGLTPMQSTMLAQHSLVEVTQMIDDSPLANANLILPQLIKERHFLFNTDGVDPASDDANLQRMVSMLATQAYKIIMTNPDEVEDYLKFSLANKITSFAGPGIQAKFPSANTWFEIVLPPGKRAMVPPLGEGIKTDQMRLRINRVAILASCGLSIFPFPTESDGEQVAELMASPMFLNEANILFFVDVEGHGIQTYAGIIQYGTGGARVYKVRTLDNTARAIQGDPPNFMTPPTMPHFAQFACGTLTQLIRFYRSKGTHEFEALRAYHRFAGQTGFSDDVMLETEQG